jgi:hypothetical protein
MAKFEYTPPEIDIDRAYVLVDDTFDVHFLRTHEGLIIDVWEHEQDLLGTLALENPTTEEE